MADAFDHEDIKIRTVGPASSRAGASYDNSYDSIELAPSFTIGNARDEAYLVHECTHAHLDIQCIGSNSAHENEAVAYVAEAVYLEVTGNPPLDSGTIRSSAHTIAKGVLSGTYEVSAVDAANLIREIAANPNYTTKAFYNSNGFKRGLLHRWLR